MAVEGPEERAFAPFLRALLGDSPELDAADRVEVEVALLVLEVRAVTAGTLARADELVARASNTGSPAFPRLRGAARAARATLRSIDRRIAGNKRAADALAAVPADISHQALARLVSRARAVWRGAAPLGGGPRRPTN